MIKKLTTITIWFMVAIILLFVNVSFLSAYQRGTRTSLPFPNQLYDDYDIKTSAPSSTGSVIGVSITSEDARSLILKKFIERYKPSSPFYEHTDHIVAEADKYNIDFRLLPAIAMCESNLGSRIPSSDSFNAWGIAVYTNINKGKHFEDWEAAISWVSKFIREKFYDRNITSLYDIGAIWAPPSIDNNYSWTRCVQGFMDKMQ